MINYERLGKSVSFYNTRGYKQIEVPWMITPEAVALTLPEGATPMALTNGKVLTGSAEQSFLQMILEEKLSHGDYQAITPCFRDDEVDELHQKTFMKNELFVFPKPTVTEKDLDKILHIVLSDAHDYFMLQTVREVNIVKTEIGYDICCRGIELGSYGIRNVSGIKWVYGTGLAEPRLTYVKQHQWL